MKRKAFFLAVFLLVLAVLPFHTSAETVSEKRCRLEDGADLLSASEESVLIRTLDAVSTKYSLDVVVVTIDALGSENEAVLQEKADSYLDRYDYGFGAHNNGILLLRTQNERFWALSTIGNGISAFTDEGLDYLSDNFTPYLAEDDYVSAFIDYANRCDELLALYKEGTPYTGEEISMTTKVVISLLAGIIIGIIGVLIMRGKLKSVTPQRSADSYIRQDSFHLTESRDMFLYHTVTRTPRPKDNGGSSTHTSSGGFTHGGSSGRA